MHGSVSARRGIGCRLTISRHTSTLRRCTCCSCVGNERIGVVYEGKSAYSRKRLKLLVNCSSGSKALDGKRSRARSQPPATVVGELLGVTRTGGDVLSYRVPSRGIGGASVGNVTRLAFGHVKRRIVWVGANDCAGEVGNVQWASWWSWWQRELRDCVQVWVWVWACEKRLRHQYGVCQRSPAPLIIRGRRRLRPLHPDAQGCPLGAPSLALRLCSGMPT